MNAESFRLVPAGDSALIVEFADTIDPLVNQRAIFVAAALERASLAGVRDVVPTFRSVGIHFDPLRTDYDALVDRVRTDAAMVESRSIATDADPIRVPVCYGREFGPDLADVAAFAGISESEAIRLHTSRSYRVFMLGFVPGFAYMGSVDARIAAPRLPVPRTRVPRGAVGIAGRQTGIYPAPTPGGWRIVGRTPLEPFDLTRPEPFLFKPGDAVRFYAIEPAEYDRAAGSR